MPIIHTTDLPWKSTPVNGVSAKELIHERQGTGKLIQLVPGARYPEHRHPDKLEYVYVLDGTLTMQLDQETLEAKSGDFVEIPQNHLHTLENWTSRDVVLWVGAVMLDGPDRA